MLERVRVPYEVIGDANSDGLAPWVRGGRLLNGWAAALQVRILFHPLETSEALASSARGTGLEFRQPLRHAGSTPAASAELPEELTTWPKGKAPVCKAGHAGSSPAVVSNHG